MKYWAFISYRHLDNDPQRDGLGNRWADWLSEELERYVVPPELVGKPGHGEPVPERIFPVFQDEKELPTNSNLGEMVNAALRESRFLIVLCSPRVLESKYVAAEIRYFKSLGRGNRILPVILDGEPNVSDGTKPGFAAANECFPEALRFKVGPDGATMMGVPDAEPICANLRDASGKEGRLGDRSQAERREIAKLKVIAGILGVNFDDLYQREKKRQIEEARARQRRQAILSTVFGVLAVAALIGGFIALRQKQRADREARVAIEQRDRATQAERGIQEALTHAEFAEASRRLGDPHDTSRALAYLGSSLSRQPYAPAESRLQDLILHRSWLVEREAVSLMDLGTDAFDLSPALDRVVRWRAGEPGALTGISLQPIGSGSGGKTVDLCEPAVQAVFPDTAECVVTQAPADGGRLRCRFWRTSDGVAVGNLLLEPGQTPVGVSPKGRYALIGDERGRTLSLVRTADGQRLVELPAEDGWRWQADVSEPRLMVFAPDESAVFVGDRKGDTETFVRGKKTASPRVRIRGYATADGRELWRLDEPGDIAHLVCAPDGSFVIYSFAANGVENWQLVLHPLKPEIAAWQQPVAQMPGSLLLGPDGCTMAVADRNVVTLRDPYLGGERRCAPITLPADVHDLAFSHDGRRLAYVTKLPEVGVIDTGTGTLAVEPRLFGDEVFAAAFSRDDRTLQLRTKKAVRSFALQVSPVAPREIKPASELPLQQVAADPQGRGVVLLSGDGQAKGAVELRSPAGGAGAPPSFLNEPANAAAFSPDGKLLAVAAGALANEDGGSLWLFEVPDVAWKTGSKPLVGRRIAVGGGMPRRIAIGADGRLALLDLWSRTEKAGRVVLVDLATGAVLPDFMDQGKGVNAVVFSPDGRLLATAEGGRTVRIWDVVQRRQIGAEARLGSSPETLEFSPDGTKLAVGSRYGDERGTVQMLSAEGKSLWPEPRVFMTGVQKVRFAPDGVLLAVSFKGGTVEMLDAATGRPRTGEPSRLAREIEGLVRYSSGRTDVEPLASRSEVIEMCFFPAEGRRSVLVAVRGSMDRRESQVELLDPESGMRIGSLVLNDGAVRGVAALAAGRFVAWSLSEYVVGAVPWTTKTDSWSAELFPSVAETMGGWRLNEWRAPERADRMLVSLVPMVSDLPQWKQMFDWLAAPVERRTVEPGDSVKLDERLAELVTKGYLAEYRQVLDLQPDHPTAMAEYWFTAARETAEAAFLAAVKDRPREDRMQRQMEWAQLSNEARRERIFANPKAKRLADFWTAELCAKHPELARAWQERATFLRLVGREAESAVAVEKALELGGGNFAAREQLALLKAQQGDFAGAAEQLDKLCDWLEKNPPSGDDALRMIAKAGQNRLHFGTVGRGMDNVSRDVRWLVDNLTKALAPISRLTREQGNQLNDASEKLTDFLARFEAGPALSAEAHARLIEALKGKTGTTNFETVQATLLGHRAFAAILCRDTAAAQRDLAEAKRICPDLEVGLEVWRAHALAIEGRADDARTIYETMLELDAEMAGALSKELALDFQRLQRRGIALRGLEDLQRRVFQRVAAQPTGILVVSALRPGDQAEKAGIKVGDRLVSYAGEPVLDWDWFVWERQIESRQGLREPRAVVVEREGRQLTFEVQSGRLGLGAKQP